MDLRDKARAELRRKGQSDNQSVESLNKIRKLDKFNLQRCTIAKLKSEYQNYSNGAEQGSVNLADVHIHSTAFHADSRGAVRFSKKNYLLVFDTLNTYSNQTKRMIEFGLDL